MLKTLLKGFLILSLMLVGVTEGCAANKFGTRPDVQRFIHVMVKKHHFSQDQLTHLFNQVHTRPRIMQSLKAPLEARPWNEYRVVFINPSHIEKGVEYWKRNEQVLNQAQKQYGVPASIIVATIGVETMYGKNKGEYPVIDALATIAFSNSHRAGYFRKELEDFLLLAREQGINPLKIKGSYAGAIGQPQFMPSSYRSYAVSFSGKKQIDLNNNEADIIASIANYYHLHGWKPEAAVAIPTTVQKSGYRELANINPDSIKTKKQLSHYGIYPYYRIPSDEDIRLIQLSSRNEDEYWIGLNNFQVIKRYNPNNLYAMAVYQLSSYITLLREKLNHG